MLNFLEEWIFTRWRIASKFKKKVSLSDLTWKDPLGSQVVSDDASIVKELDKTEYDSFMEPAEKMKTIVPDMIQAKCNKFVDNFCCRDLDTFAREI